MGKKHTHTPTHTTTHHNTTHNTNTHTYTPLRGRRGTQQHTPTHTHTCVAQTHIPHTHMRGRRGTNSHPPSFCVAGVALMALGGALGLAWSPVTPGTPRHFAWQAWHKLTSTVVLRGRRGTTSHPPSFCVAGVALMALGGALGLAWSPVTPRHFAWQAWHNLTSTVVLRGRRGTHGTGWRAWTGLVARDALDAAALCVAGVAQTHIHRRFAWQAWHLRGRRGTHGTGWRAWTGLVARDAAALCVAGVAQTHVVLRGRRGTNSHPPSFCVAGVALMALGGALGLAWSPVTPGTPRHFAWQAWHKLTSTVVLRGRRGICVAGVALMALGGALGLAWSPVMPGTPRHFAWQAWHNLTSTVVLRGRRGTNSHPPSFCVAGVALMALGGALGLAWSPVTPGTPRHFAWQAWHKLTSTVVLRGKRGICVAGVALMALGGALGLAWSPVTPGTPRHFAWQAWHKLTSTVVLRGRRGTNSHPPSFCVAGVALMALGGALGLAWSPVTPGTPRHFAWQAWHKLTSTVVLRGRRGTTSHPLSFCVAGVALTHTHTGQVKLVICMQRCGPCSWSRGRAQLRFSNAVQRRHDRFCFLHADFHHVVVVVLFWSN